MVKLLIEIELEEKDAPQELDHNAIEELFDDMAMGYIGATWKATLTDDKGEILRESE